MSIAGYVQGHGKKVLKKNYTTQRNFFLKVFLRQK